MRRSKSDKCRAFTLVEMLVVLAILAILASVILPNVVGKTDKARRTKAKADIAIMESLLDEFYLDMRRYPTSDEGLRTLYYPPSQDAEGWGGPYSKKPITNDPWGSPYVYRSPGSREGEPYEIICYGKDGKEGGEGDDADITSSPEPANE